CSPLRPAAPPAAPTPAPVNVPQAARVSMDNPRTDVTSRFVMTSLLIASTGTLLGEQIRKETLDGVSDPDGAVASVAPRRLRRRRRRLTRLLHLFSAVLRAIRSRLADASGRLPDAFRDLAIAALDLSRRGLHLRAVGREGKSGCQHRKPEREHESQPQSFHRGSSF